MSWIQILYIVHIVVIQANRLLYDQSLDLWKIKGQSPSRIQNITKIESVPWLIISTS